jgi:hypothetical protein
VKDWKSPGVRFDDFIKGWVCGFLIANSLPEFEKQYAGIRL